MTNITISSKDTPPVTKGTKAENDLSYEFTFTEQNQLIGLWGIGNISIL